MLSLTALAGLTAYGWPWNTDMAQQPSLPTYAGPRPPAPGALAVHGEFPLERWQMEERLHNPLPPSTPPDKGRVLYSTYCFPCHGSEGRGDGPVAKVFVLPRNLRSPEVQNHLDAWIYGTIRNGSNMMPRYGHELAPPDRWEVVTYVRTFREPPR